MSLIVAGEGTVVHYDSQMQVLLLKAYVTDAFPELSAVCEQACFNRQKQRHIVHTWAACVKYI